MRLDSRLPPDLSGSSTNAMLTLGGGAMVPLWRMLLLDVQYRYSRIFSDEGINRNRASVSACAFDGVRLDP